MTTTDRIASDVSALGEDAATLKGEAARVIDDLRSRAVDAGAAARDAAGRLGDEGLRLYRTAADQTERSVQTVSRQVSDQPVASVLLAFGLGLLAGRLLR